VAFKSLRVPSILAEIDVGRLSFWSSGTKCFRSERLIFASEILNLKCVFAQSIFSSLLRVILIIVESVARLVWGRSIMANGTIREESVISMYVLR
jgi:hypothetical protein